MTTCKALTNISAEAWNSEDTCCFQADDASPRAVDISDLSSFCDTWKVADSDSQSTPLRVITYNIHGWRDTFHNDNLDRIISVLSKLDADVIALQEVLHPYRPPADPVERAEYFDRVKAGKGNGFVASSTPWVEDDRTGGPLPYLNELSRALGMPYISFGQATSDGYFGRFGYGNAVLTRFPIAHEEHLVVRPDAKHQAGRRIEAEDRCFSAVALAGAAAGLTVCVTHLDQLSDELRLEQVAALAPRRTCPIFTQLGGKPTLTMTPDHTKSCNVYD